MSSGERNHGVFAFNTSVGLFTEITGLSGLIMNRMTLREHGHYNRPVDDHHLSSLCGHDLGCNWPCEY